MYSITLVGQLCYESINEIEALNVEPCFHSFQLVFVSQYQRGASSGFEPREANQLPGPNSVLGEDSETANDEDRPSSPVHRMDS